MYKILSCRAHTGSNALPTISETTKAQSISPGKLGITSYKIAVINCHPPQNDHGNIENIRHWLTNGFRLFFEQAPRQTGRLFSGVDITVFAAHEHQLPEPKHFNLIVGSGSACNVTDLQNYLETSNQRLDTCLLQPSESLDSQLQAREPMPPGLKWMARYALWVKRFYRNACADNSSATNNTQLSPETKKPKHAPLFLPICFSHQLTAFALGGRVGYNKDRAWCFGMKFIHVRTPQATTSTTQIDASKTNSFQFYAYHSQCVIQRPQAALVLGTSTHLSLPTEPSTENPMAKNMPSYEIFCYPSHNPSLSKKHLTPRPPFGLFLSPVISVQFHPENWTKTMCTHSFMRAQNRLRAVKNVLENTSKALHVESSSIHTLPQNKKAVPLGHGLLFIVNIYMLTIRQQASL